MDRIHPAATPTERRRLRAHGQRRSSAPEIGSLPYERQDEAVRDAHALAADQYRAARFRSDRGRSRGSAAGASRSAGVSNPASTATKLKDTVISTLAIARPVEDVEVRSRYVIAADGAGSVVRDSSRYPDGWACGTWRQNHDDPFRSRSARHRRRQARRSSISSSVPGPGGVLIAYDIGRYLGADVPHRPDLTPLDIFTDEICRELVTRGRRRRGTRPENYRHAFMVHVRAGRQALSLRQCVSCGRCGSSFSADGRSGPQHRHRRYRQSRREDRGGRKGHGWRLAILDSYEPERQPSRRRIWARAWPTPCASACSSTRSAIPPGSDGRRGNLRDASCRSRGACEDRRMRSPIPEGLLRQSAASARLCVWRRVEVDDAPCRSAPSRQRPSSARGCRMSRRTTALDARSRSAATDSRLSRVRQHERGAICRSQNAPALGHARCRRPRLSCHLRRLAAEKMRLDDRRRAACSARWSHVFRGSKNAIAACAAQLTARSEAS